MDRSFLTDARIVKASREFVCIRLATYEDAEEAKFLKTVFTGRDGELQNTVFAILSPDGKEFLCRTGRSPEFAFRSPESMAQSMAKMAHQFPARNASRSRPPRMKSFRLALDVAACDGLPLVLAAAESDEQIKAMEARLAAIASDSRCGGRFHFVVVDSSDDGLARIVGYDDKPGIYVVQPGQFGISGTIEESIASDTTLSVMCDRLATYADTHDPIRKEHRQHVWSGRQQGINWTTEIPVTDRMALRAQQQGRFRDRRENN